jgi:hypothetical protein
MFGMKLAIHVPLDLFPATFLLRYAEYIHRNASSLSADCKQNLEGMDKLQKNEYYKIFIKICYWF